MPLPLIERFRQYMPLEPGDPVVSLNEGSTPLVEAPRLSEVVGARVYLKIEGANPTGSFKDRGMTVAVSRAKGRGAEAVICASTGNTSASAAAACLGAPLMNDFAVVSLSDLLTPLEVIERRLTAAADGDFVLALYNPRSTRRHEPLRRALAILRARRAPDTPVGLVRNALRDGQEARITTLGELREEDVDMLTLLVVGNGATSVRDGRMVTPRGYRT